MSGEPFTGIDGENSLGTTRRDRRRVGPGEWIWWALVVVCWAAQLWVAKGLVAPHPDWSPLALLGPASLACLVVALRGSSRATGGFPWARRRASHRELTPDSQVSLFENSNSPGESRQDDRRKTKPSAAALARRLRWLEGRCRRRSLVPVFLATVHFAFVLIYFAILAHSPYAHGPFWVALRFGLILLVSQAAAVLIGNALEGPFLECLASRRRQDGGGRALQALFHTIFLGLGSSALLLVLYPLFRWAIPDLGFRDAMAFGALMTLPIWQLLRFLTGRIALRWVARRGPFEIIPVWTGRAARKVAAPPDGGRAEAPVRPGWGLLPWGVGSLGAGFAALLLLPFWVGLSRLLAAGNDRVDVEEVSTTIAFLAVTLEVLAAAFAGAGVVLWRHRRIGPARGGGDAGSLDPAGHSIFSPPGWRMLAGFVLPWLVLWVPLTVYALRAIAPITNRGDLYGIPMAWIVFTFPIGLIQGVALGVSYGLRRMTAAAAGCQAFWFQGLGVFILSSLSTLGLVTYASLPNDFGLLNLGPFVRLWTASPILRSISLLPESIPSFHPDVLVALFSVWLGRAFQLLFLAIYRRRIAWNAARVSPPDRRWFGGVAFGWWRLLRGNPVVGRTLGRPPHGGHRWFGALRVGIYLGVLLVIAVVSSLAVEGVPPRGGPPVWYVFALVIGIGGALASGAWAGLLGVLAARKVRNSGEEQELHLSLLKGEEIVAGRIAAVFGLTVLWAFVLPLLASWPFALIPEIKRHLWFFAMWFVLIYGTTIGSSSGDAAVGLWLGARWRNGVAAGFAAVLWGGLMGSWTAIASLSGIVLTEVWMEETARQYMRDETLALLGTFGLAWGLIPICTRMVLGDWFGRRLSADLLGGEKG